MGADVQVGHWNAAATGRIQRESAGKAEGIQHHPPGRQGFHEAAVLALVEKETSLLPAQYVRLKSKTALQKYHRPVRSGTAQHLSVTVSKPFQGHVLDVAAQAQDNSFVGKLSADQFGHFLQSRQPRRRVKLEHERRVSNPAPARQPSLSPLMQR